MWSMACDDKNFEKGSEEALGYAVWGLWMNSVYEWIFTKIVHD